MKIKLRVTGEMYFEILILAFIITMFIASIGLPERTKRLPLLIAWITLIITMMDLIISIIKQFRHAEQIKPLRIDKNLLIKTSGSLGFMLLTLIMWKILGYIVTSIMITILFSLFLGAKNRISLVILSVLLTFGIYIVFRIFLKVPLPGGIIF